jgi:hypothetical protein
LPPRPEGRKCYSGCQGRRVNHPGVRLLRYRDCVRGLAGDTALHLSEDWLWPPAQTTPDAYLAQLARHHTGRGATFDDSFPSLDNDVTDLVPS